MISTIKPPTTPEEHSRFDELFSLQPLRESQDLIMHELGTDRFWIAKTKKGMFTKAPFKSITPGDAAKLFLKVIVPEVLQDRFKIVVPAKE